MQVDRDIAGDQEGCNLLDNVRATIQALALRPIVVEEHLPAHEKPAPLPQPALSPVVYRFRVHPAKGDEWQHLDGVVLDIPPECIAEIKADIDAISELQALSPAEPDSVWCTHFYVAGKPELQREKA